MIPKTIHFFWDGGARSPLAQTCIASWRRAMPAWEVREWNGEAARELCELPGFPFFEKALAAGKWAMASDWLRMAVLWREGGVYLDADVELVGDLEELCRKGEWVAGEWTARGAVWMNPGGGLALEKGSPVARRMLEAYARSDFDAHRSMMPWINEHLEEARAAAGEGKLTILPPEVMSPIDIRGRLHRTFATVGIHHYAMGGTGPLRRFLKWLSWHGGRGLVEFLLKVRGEFARAVKI